MTLLKAGARAGFSSTGRRGTRHSTPTASTSVVTRLLVATDRVETMSFSGVPTWVPQISRAFTAQGSLRLTALPVMKVR